MNFPISSSDFPQCRNGKVSQSQAQPHTGRPLLRLNVFYKRWRWIAIDSNSLHKWGQGCNVISLHIQYDRFCVRENASRRKFSKIVTGFSTSVSTRPLRKRFASLIKFANFLNDRFAHNRSRRGLGTIRIVIMINRGDSADNFIIGSCGMDTRVASAQSIDIFSSDATSVCVTASTG